MDYFFYGSLADVGALARVLGRRPRQGCIAAATAPGRRIVALAGSVYPTLIADAAACAPGIVVSSLGAVDRARLRAWEGSRYRLITLVVEDDRGGRRQASAFVAASPCAATRRPWPPPGRGRPLGPARS